MLSEDRMIYWVLALLFCLFAGIIAGGMMQDARFEAIWRECLQRNTAQECAAVLK